MNAQSEAMKYFDALTDNVDRLTQLFAEGLNEIGDRTETESIKNTAEDGGTKYLIRESVTDVNGKVYDYVIDIDDDFTQKNINGRRYERFIDRMAGQIIGVTDIDGEKEFIMFANKNDKVRKDKKSRPALGELKYMSGDYRKSVIVNISDSLRISTDAENGISTENSHGWLDKNGWATKLCYILSNDTIYPAYLKIARAADGRNILYAINVNIKEGVNVDKSSPSAAVEAETPSENDSTSNSSKSQQKFSDRDRADMTAEQRKNTRPDIDRTDVVFADSGISYYYEGKTEDGRSIYHTNYGIGTPKTVKQNDIINLVQNVWSKNPIKLNVIENNEIKEINASFNPELTERSDLSKIAFGNRKGTGSEKRITYNLSSDFYQIASESKYVGSKDETGKQNEAHKGVTKWNYFVTNLVYEEDDGKRIDCYMNIDVKQNGSGDWFYSFAIEKGTAPQTLLAVVTENDSATVPKNSIPNPVENVNSKNKESARNSAGNQLTPQQAEYFKDSQERDPDIRYSDRDVELKKQYEKINRQLERENSQLREDVKNLRELNRLQGKVTGGKVFKGTSIQSVGRQTNLINRIVTAICVII